MEFGRALSFPWKSEGWVSKIAIGCILNLIPLLNLANYGYGMEVTRRVAYGEAEELPAWDQLGRYFVRGLAVGLAAFLYMLPGMLLAGLLLVGTGFEDEYAPAAAAIYFGWSVILMLMMPIAVLRYALTDQWFTMFDFSWIWSVIGRNLGSYLAILIVGVLLSMLLIVLGTLALGIGAIVASFWSVLMFFHLFGQLGRRTVTG